MSAPVYPTKAEFACAPYGDGSGHEITVSYDTCDKDDWRCKIRLNGLDVTFDYQHAQAVLDAIRYAAFAIEAHTRKEPTQ